LSYNPTDIFKQTDLVNLKKLLRIDTDIIIRGEFIKTLGEIEKINGFLGISHSSIENLGNLKRIQKDFWISSYTVLSRLNSLNKLEYVGGDVSLRYSNVKNLGNLKKVGGKLSLRDTEIKDLGLLEYVGGDLYLPKKFQNEIDISKVNVQGKIRFWNDSKTKKNLVPKSELGLINYLEKIPQWNHKYIYYFNEIKEATSLQKKFYQEYKKYFLKGEYLDVEGNNNYTFILFYDLIENHSQDLNLLQTRLKKLEKYYPITKGYTNSAIIRKFESENDFETAWKLKYQEEYIGYESIIEFEEKFGRKLLDGELLVKLGGFSHLTEFGQNNIQEIKPFGALEIEKYENEKGVDFFGLFLINNEPIKTKQSGTSLIYDAEYYKSFFLANSEYQHYKAIDDFQIKSNYVKKIPHVVEKAIYNQCRLILKNTEDSYREKIGMPKVGEGWISETELFYKVSDYFKDLEVIHHASPKWLGRQHLDIYIPKFKIGIEYQGAQHYEPNEFFGGQKAFEQTVERDKRKKQLCEENNCLLIYVEKGYDIKDIVSKIERIKNGVQQRI
jgi:hypothetical protein